jgi:hypothetical protein
MDIPARCFFSSEWGFFLDRKRIFPEGIYRTNYFYQGVRLAPDRIFL